MKEQIKQIWSFPTTVGNTVGNKNNNNNNNNNKACLMRIKISINNNKKNK